MRELKWTEHEVIECLGVLSSFDEDSVAYDFNVEKDGLVLELAICAYQSFVEIQLSKTESSFPIFKASFFVLNEVRYVNEKNVAFLEFSDCVISTRWGIESPEPRIDGEQTSFQIHMFPAFQLKFV